MKKIISILLGICLMALAVPTNIVKADEASPKLIIESYVVDGDYDIGQDTSIKLVLKNMSDTLTMTDIILSFSSDSTVIPALGTSNQVYVESIAPGETAEVSLNVAIISATNGYAKMSFSATYSYGAKVTYVNSEDRKVTEYQTLGSYSNSSSFIMFPVVTVTSFTVNNVNVASSTNVGAKAIVGIRYSNPGKDAVSNVKMVISYDGKTETVDIGSVKEGASSYLEHYITFSTVGTKTISIMFQYDNSAGKTENILVGDYSIDVKSANVAATPTPAGGSGESDSVFSDPTFAIIIAVIGVIIISGIFGLISVNRRK